MFKREVLDNGIPLVMEKVPGVRSLCVGIWVKVGTRFETPAKNGISHFLEHMLFKGTKTRTQKDIAVEIDALGGDINAFTSREYTAFYVKVLGDYIGRGMDVLSDLYMNSLLTREDMEKEKEIITEEIKMVEDSPEEYVHDYFYQDIWGSTGLGMPVLGNETTVQGFKREDLLQHEAAYYGAGNTVISCAGDIDFSAMTALVNGTLGGLNRGTGSTEAGHGVSSLVQPGFRRGVNVYEKDQSEVHICMGVEGIKQDSKLRYPFLLLNVIFGSGVSSRLFQEIRENRGLVYTIYSFLSSYYDIGVFGVYAGTGPKKYVEVIDQTIKEMKELGQTITQTELDRAKSHLKGNLVLNLESSSSRMQNIARQEIYYGKYYSPNEIIKGIDEVTMKDVHEIIETYARVDNLAVTVLGPARKDQLASIVPTGVPTGVSSGPTG